MEDEPYVVLVEQQLAQPVGGSAEARPLVGGQFGRLGERAGLLVPVHRRDEDEVVRAGGRGERGDLPDVGEHLVPRLRLVQGAEGGAAGDLEPAGVQLLLQPLRVGGEIAVGAELQPFVPGRGQFVEEACVRHLLIVLGEPDAPGVGGGAQAEVAGDGTEWAWCRCHDMSLHPEIGSSRFYLSRSTSAL